MSAILIALSVTAFIFAGFSLKFTKELGDHSAPLYLIASALFLLVAKMY